MEKHRSYEPSARSSIALLQERFRKLEKVKATREEKELRLFTRAECLDMNLSPRFCHADPVHTSNSVRAPSTLQHEPHGGDFIKSRAFEPSLRMDPDKSSVNFQNNYKDVDTSLHL